MSTLPWFAWTLHRKMLPSLLGLSLGSPTESSPKKYVSPKRKEAQDSSPNSSLPKQHLLILESQQLGKQTPSMISFINTTTITKGSQQYLKMHFNKLLPFTHMMKNLMGPKKLLPIPLVAVGLPVVFPNRDQYDYYKRRLPLLLYYSYYHFQHTSVQHTVTSPARGLDPMSLYLTPCQKNYSVHTKEEGGKGRGFT